MNQQEQKSIAYRINQFSIALYRHLRKQEGSLFLSPFSVAGCLTMVYAGARGETEKQMARVLCLPGNQESLHETLGGLIREMNGAPGTEDSQLSVANALWTEVGCSFFPEFLDLLKTMYGSEPHALDFEKDPETACRVINEWIEKHTQNRIRGMAHPGMFGPLTRLVLTNAIFFKGQWALPFDETFTELAPFKVRDESGHGSSVDVWMMGQTEAFPYMEAGGFQALELPYESPELSMIIFLPKKEADLPNFEASLNIERLTESLKSLQTQEVQVFIPKFQFTSEFSLVKPLSSMGMRDLFNYKTADLSGMTDEKELEISEVIHKAFIDVNEEGTEAAAANLLAGCLADDEEPPKPVPIFRADHPFLFLIRDIRSESILFMGRVADDSAFE